MTERLIAASEAARALIPVLAADLPAALDAAPPLARALAEAAEFKAKAGQILFVPAHEGSAAQALLGLGDGDVWTAFRAAAARLPGGDYRLEPQRDDDAHAIAFALGGYRFDRYKPRGEAAVRLVVEDEALRRRALRISHACALARDMVNTPANDMGPLQIETIAREFAEQYGADLTVTLGDGLLEAGYPSIHAVGRAAHPDRAPRLIELSWGEASHPVVAIVGKGVVFDTGGLDIKPSGAMRNMKKDMGGAAHALALARMVMDAGLPVRLVTLLPVVENAISGDAMRPGDVLATRKGLTVEVGNTDAEGRLILADALTRAGEHDPVLTIDLATLTGAARVALGPQVIPFYTDDDDLAADLAEAAKAQSDPLWRMPLWPGYADSLDSDVADLKNDPDGWAQAGSVTAGLFLKRFAPAGAWVHLDIFAWNPRARLGFPSGGEAQAIRALFAMLTDRFG